ncbi:MAG: YncE family protein [Acidobacteria bacterium]|nr:YncE family protein [Acidobacteriota bacterium]
MTNISRQFSHRVFSQLLHTALVVLISTCAASAQQTGGEPKEQQDQPFYRVPANADKKAKTAPVNSVSQHFEKEGIKIDFSLEAVPGADGKKAGLVAGADAIATFRVADTRAGQPVTGLRPNAWINARETAQAPNEVECKDKIRSYMSGLLSVRPAVDLNSFVALTLNHDNSITFINPQVSFNLTKLESIVVLPGPGTDWALSKSKDFLYVTLPEQSAVAIINTITRRLVGTIPVGDKTKPARIALQPDGRYVWVGLDGSPLVAAIDTATNKLAATVNVGAGLHNLAFTADSRYLYVTNSAADTVSVVETKTLAKLSDIATGKTPVPVAYSSASGYIYAAALNGGAITVIDPAKQKVLKTIPVARGVVALRFEPAGRYGFAVNQLESKVYVFDAATGAMLGASDVAKSPDQVAFTRGYAYIRGTQSEKFSLIEINDLKKGKFAPVEIQAGRRAASELPEDIGVADMIAPTPEGNSVMVANAPDQMLYYYVEGMMAPMGTIQNYKRRPHALMIIDRSLSEIAPGVYSSPVKLRSAGRFDVPFLIDQPRIVNCFELEVAPSPDGEKNVASTAIAVEAQFKGKQFKPGEPATLRFKITDAVTKQPVTGLTDVHILVFELPGVWQQRQWAKEVGEGVYELTQVFPRAGAYNVMMAVASRGVRFADLPFTSVAVLDEAKPQE